MAVWTHVGHDFRQYTRTLHEPLMAQLSDYVHLPVFARSVITRVGTCRPRVGASTRLMSTNAGHDSRPDNGDVRSRPYSRTPESHAA